MKKVKHKRKVGEVVDFIFFDGSKKTGKIVELTYHGDNIDSVRTQYDLPTYRIHVPDKKYSRGYMVYSSMTDMRIEDAKTKQAVEEFWEDESGAEITHIPDKLGWLKKYHNNVNESELDNAIKKQKDFLEKH